MNTKNRFVIQKHSKQGKNTHWDLMLKKGKYLQTYRLSLPPKKLKKQQTKAEIISNHPLKFLKYEGLVNNGLGNVKIADRGTYKITKKDKTSLNIQFNGEILKSEFILAQVDSNLWEFECKDNT